VFCVTSPPERSRDSRDGAPRRKLMRIRDPMFITAPAGREVLLEIVNFPAE